jgi:hypothetical protein
MGETDSAYVRPSVYNGPDYNGFQPIKQNLWPNLQPYRNSFPLYRLVRGQQ